MYDELVRLGHTVHVYTPIPNTIWPDMPPYRPDVTYDLGLLNHNNCLEALRGRNINKIVFTSHGVIPQPEWPVDGADIYVAVSEEVRDSDKMAGRNAVVIRNPIDTFKFSSRPVSKNLRNVLFLSNYGWKVQETIDAATEGLHLERIGGNRRVHDIEKHIAAADLVIGLGRSVYEAMSMAKNVIVYDYQGGDGFVTPENIFRFRERNCSGRTNRLYYTPEQLRAELDKYDPALGPELRAYILEHNDVRKIADQYLSL